jgi:Protein of unknown function (DUF1285)
MTPDASPPPFRFSRESRIRIDADGHLWHDGERVEHPRLARALASWVDFDDEAQRYVLRNSLDWCWITVDLAPLTVRNVRFSGDDPEVELSDDSREALRLDTVRATLDGEVWAYVRGGTLLARFDRSAAFALLDRVVQSDDGALSFAFGARTVPLRLLAPGERLPPRPGGPFARAAPST